MGASATCTSTSRSARTAAATATSSPSSGGADSTLRTSTRLAELALERGVLAERVETVFLGGGTPTFTDAAELARLLDALPPRRS